jgi:hypothetical protein
MTLRQVINGLCHVILVQETSYLVNYFFFAVAYLTYKWSAYFIIRLEF